MIALQKSTDGSVPKAYVLPRITIGYGITEPTGTVLSRVRATSIAVQR